MYGKKMIAGAGMVLIVIMLVGSPHVGVLAGQHGIQEGVADSVTDQLLTFIHSAAKIIGSGIVKIVEIIADVNVSELQQPLGYLGILTASLVVFGALKAAQKIIWFIVLLGWGLIIVRIVLEALDKAPVR